MERIPLTLVFVLMFFLSITSIAGYTESGSSVDSDSSITGCNGDMHIQDSTITNSDIECTNITNSVISDSVISNASLGVTDADVDNAVINGGSLTSGRFIYDEKSYFGPFKLSQIYAGAPPSDEGILELDRDVLAPDSEFHLEYTASETGYTVTLDASEVNAGSGISLSDDGLANDGRANDGVYTSGDIVVGSSVTTGTYTLTVNIDDNVGNQWSLDIDVYVDDNPPEGTFHISNIETNDPSDVTESRVVYLHMTADDDSGISGCRIANEDENIGDKDFTSCTETKTWVLTHLNGEKTVTYEIMNNNGQITALDDTIELNLTELTEPPRVDMPTVNWGNTEYVEFDILYDEPIDTHEMTFDYRIYEENYSGNITPWTYSESSTVLHQGLNLKNNTEYQIGVRSYLGNISPEGFIDFAMDTTLPEITSFTPSVEDAQWTSDPVISFDVSSMGVGVAGLSYRFSQDGEAPNQNVDVSGDEAVVHLTGMSSGEFYFTIKAITYGGLASDVINFSVRYDNIPPPIPEPGSPSISGIGTLKYNWSDVTDDVSGIDHYNVEVSSDSFFENIIDEANVTDNFYDFSAESADTYYFRVRSRNNAGLYSPFSTEDKAFFDTKPPRFTMIKPEGLVSSSRPIIHLETDQPAECFYSLNFTEEGFIGEPFDFTGSNVHEVRKDLDDGSEYNIAFSCTDSAGNVNSTSTRFEIDQSIYPDEIFLESNPDNLSARTSSEYSFEIRLRDSGDGVGELPLDEFSLFVDDEEYDNYVVNDRGNGTYLVSLITPDVEEDIDVEVCYDNLCTDTNSISLTELRLEVSVGLGGSYTINEESTISHAVQDNILLGLASDSDSISFTSSTEEDVMRMSNIVDDRNNYVFFTPSDIPDRTLRLRDRDLSKKTFFEDMNPTFYYASTEDLDVNMLLRYGYVTISEESLAIPSGKHSILIRNEGATSDNRVNLTMRVN